jgi:hypothetical protein
MTEEKVMENRIRRVALRRGMKVVKSRRRDPKALDYGGYMLVDVARNFAILGGSPNAYSATIEEIDAYLNEAWRACSSNTVTIMQDEDIKLLRRIVAGGGRKYTAGNIDRSRYDRLVDLGWLTPFKTNISDIEYQVTEKGRAASVANVHDWSHPPLGELGLRAKSE